MSKFDYEMSESEFFEIIDELDSANAEYNNALAACENFIEICCNELDEEVAEQCVQFLKQKIREI